MGRLGFAQEPDPDRSTPAGGRLDLHEIVARLQDAHRRQGSEFLVHLTPHAQPGLDRPLGQGTAGEPCVVQYARMASSPALKAGK